MKELMDALAKLYEKPSASNKVFLMKRLFNMKMSEGGSVADHLNEFNTVTNQLSSVKVDFDDEVRALLILCSLPERWNGLVMVVSNSVSGSNTLKFDDVVGVILSEEMRWKSTGETSGNALNMENRGRQKDRGKGSGNHGILGREDPNQIWKDRVLELWEERTSEERLQSSKETKRWTTGEKSGSKCNR
jgi:hypothetical protein